MTDLERLRLVAHDAVMLHHSGDPDAFAFGYLSQAMNHHDLIQCCYIRDGLESAIRRIKRDE